MASWTQRMGLSAGAAPTFHPTPQPRREGVLEEGVAMACSAGLAGACGCECECESETVAGPQAPGQAGIHGFYYFFVEKSA